MAIRDNEYNSLKDSIFDINHMLHVVSDLIKTLNKFPQGIVVEDISRGYKMSFASYSREYTRKKKKLSRLIANYLEKAEDLKDFAKIADRILIFLPGILTVQQYIDYGLPDKYTIALASRDKHITNLSDFRINLRVAKHTTRIGLDSLLGTGSGLRDVRVRTLKKIVDSSLDNRAFNTTVLDAEVNVQNTQTMLTNRLNKINNTINEFKGNLESNLSFKSIESLAQSKFKWLYMKLAQLKRNVIYDSDTPRENLEKHWRERVRNKYGGNLPFCDEVDANGSPIKVVDKNGIERFAKADEVIETSEGQYTLKSEVNMDELRKALRSDRYDTY